MLKVAVTVSQVPEASGGPFVLSGGTLAEAVEEALAVGFDAVELFLPSADWISVEAVLDLLEEKRTKVAAVGTGAGMLCQGLSLTDASESRRARAVDFVLEMIEFGGRLGAPAILGSMQGRWTSELPREEALDLLGSALVRCGERAREFGVPFLYEPLNRYESNLINRLGEGARFLREREVPNVLLLADLFHMNIEEKNLSASIREAGAAIGHVHFADSNRQAMGSGHTDPRPIVAALKDIGYDGYLSAEIFPKPSPEEACRQTIKQFRALVL